MPAALSTTMTVIDPVNLDAVLGGMGARGGAGKTDGAGLGCVTNVAVRGGFGALAGSEFGLPGMVIGTVWLGADAAVHHCR